MSHRRFPTLAGASLAAVAALMTACGMPDAMDPPPPPMEAPPPPELYGTPDGPDAYAQYGQGPCAMDPYPAAMPPPPCDPAMAPPGAGDEEEARRALAEAVHDAHTKSAHLPPFDHRPGWGTMAPVPNPDEGRREYARSGRGQPYGEPETQPYAPRGYVEVTPSREGEAVYPEGVPAAYQRSVVVTMEPIPNPSGTTRAGLDEDRAQGAPPRVRPRRRATDEGLLGGPTGRREAAPARRPARAEAAPARTARAEPARTTQRAAATAAPAARPAPQKAAAAPTTGRRSMEHFRNVLSQLVQRDSTLQAPTDIVPGRTETVTLTLPTTLAETIAREARASGLRDGAAGSRISARLVGEGWTIEPDEPQSSGVRPGQAAAFTWRATPEAGAGRLRADVDTVLPRRGGRTETLNLAQLNGPELSGAAERERDGGGGTARLIAAIVLLLVLGGAFWLLRRRDDSPATVGSTRRRRYREPVNLTPYAPNADKPAPAPGGPAT